LLMPKQLFSYWFEYFHDSYVIRPKLMKRMLKSELENLECV